VTELTEHSPLSPAVKVTEFDDPFHVEVLPSQVPGLAVKELVLSRPEA